MPAVDTIFAFLRTLRDVTNILRSHASLTLDDIIALTNARDSLSDLEPSKLDLISLQLKVECAGDGLYGELSSKVASECSAFISAYEVNQEIYDGQCSYSNIFRMMSDAAQEQVRFKKEAAVAALKKQHAIFDKYNDITRLYNSRELQPNQESAEYSAFFLSHFLHLLLEVLDCRICGVMLGIDVVQVHRMAHEVIQLIQISVDGFHFCRFLTGP